LYFNLIPHTVAEFVADFVTLLGGGWEFRNGVVRAEEFLRAETFFFLLSSFTENQKRRLFILMGPQE